MTMYPTDELFAGNGSDDLYDVFVELDLTKSHPIIDRSPETLRALFEALPEDIRNLAHSWGLCDTVFRDEAFEYYRDNGLPDHASRK
jgi:hypothetical protein